MRCWIQRSPGMTVRVTAATRIGWRSMRCTGGGCCRTFGAEFTPHLGVVLERFSVVWPQRDEAEVLAAREDAYVRPVWIEDRDWLADTMRQRWDGVVVSRGEVLEPAGLPALVAVDRGGLRIGALTFRPRSGSSGGVETEVVTVDALESGRGVGSLLLDAAATLARRTG
jgi:GNAT superfamily N-acetyltransferase